MNDSPQGVVLDVAWSLDTSWLVALSKQMHEIYGNPGIVTDNCFTLPETFGTGYIKQWRVECELTAIYVHFAPKNDVIFRRNMPPEHKRILIGYNGSAKGLTLKIEGGVIYLNQMHKYSAFINNSDSQSEIIVKANETVISFIMLTTPEYLGKLLPDLPMTTWTKPGLFQISPEQFDLIHQMEENLHNNSADFFYIKGSINQLLAQSLPMIAGTAQSSQKPEVRKLAQLVDELLQDLTTASPRISEAAARIGVSPSKFKSLFVKMYKQSYYSYLQQKKLEKAKELLLQGERSVTDVAYSLGYSSGSHFTRLFRKKFKVAPQVFKADPGNAAAKNDPQEGDN